MRFLYQGQSVLCLGQIIPEKDDTVIDREVRKSSGACISIELSTYHLSQEFFVQDKERFIRDKEFFVQDKEFFIPDKEFFVRDKEFFVQDKEFFVH